MAMADELGMKLQRELDVTTWRDLRAHAARDQVFVVSSALDLVQVGKAIASDNADQVQGWVGDGGVTRPSHEQMQAWEKNLEQTFRCLIISPFVLIQLPSTPTVLH